MKFHNLYSFFKGTALLCGVVLFPLSCTSVTQNRGGEVQYWLTKGDESVKLQLQSPARFVNTSNSFQNIEIDDFKSFNMLTALGIH
jgi:glucosylceramidase